MPATFLTYEDPGTPVVQVDYFTASKVVLQIMFGFVWHAVGSVVKGNDEDDVACLHIF